MAAFGREIKNAADTPGTGEIEEGWVVIKERDEDCQPPVFDSDDRPKRGKKGKFLKDWEN